jgi:hypothetical protein
MSFIDDWIRKQMLYSGYQPEGAQSDFAAQALAPQGGVDPRQWENGTPDFSTFSAQGGLLGAQTLGFMSDPSKMMPLLAMGAIAAGAGRGGSAPGGPPPHNPFPQYHSTGQEMEALRQLYALKKKRVPADGGGQY